MREPGVDPGELHGPATHSGYPCTVYELLMYDWGLAEPVEADASQTTNPKINLSANASLHAAVDLCPNICN